MTWPPLTRDGRFGVQQCIGDVWSFTTIRGGYETRANALATIDGLDGYRVVDRITGEIFTKEGDAA